MSLEIEARFTSPKGQLLTIAWFEGSSSARLVLTGPKGEREEVQIKRIDASLSEDVVEVLRESIFPDTASSGPLTAKLQVNTDRQRVGRDVKLGSAQSQADRLCAKLVAMANLLSTDPELKRTLAVVKKHIKSPVA